MPVAKNIIEQNLRTHFPEGKIEVIDLVGDNNHYQVKITDGSFAGKTRIQQHKMVNQALKELLKEDLHAMSLITSDK